MRSILLFLIAFYQRCVSPYLPPACRFRPTCSEYAKDALILHGPLRGSWLTFRRLIRCHPLCKGGYDPVPEPKRLHQGHSQ